MSPSDFQLEITETVAIADRVRACETISILRNHGVRIALDDFGSGHANLNVLRDLPIDCVKLDMELIPKSEDDEASRMVVEAIVKLSKALGLEVIAEGVEHDWQLKFLRELGCDKTQGYLHSKPLSESDFLSLLTSEALLDVGHSNGSRS